MPAIKTARSSPNYPLRAQKTITFDGGAGSGGIGTIALFAITGRVLINKAVAFCTTSMVSAGGGTMSVGTATNVASIIQLTTATNLATNEWWVDPTAASGIASPLYGHTGGNIASNYEKLNAEAVIINVLTGAITAGVIVFDFWYTPVTSNGLLT